MKIILSVITILISTICFGQVTEINLEKIIKNFIGPIAADSSLKKRVIFNERGSILVPENYSNKRTGTIDSDRGELTGPGFMIGYDIGYMAGTLMAEGRVKECSSYYSASVNGYKAWIGISKEKLMVTITDPDSRDISSFPANFWATVKNGDEVDGALKIIFTYRPKNDQ